MAATSIRISSLDNLPIVNGVDFIPVVQSGSSALLTTYKMPVTVLVAYFSASGSCLSASFASSSISASRAVTSSFAITSSFAGSSNFLNYPNTSTASYAITSISSSVNISSSYAQNSSNTISASYAFNSTSASYARNATNSITASYVNFASSVPPFATSSLSSSWASQSLSSSRAITASYALTAASLLVSSGPQFVAPNSILFTSATNNNGIVIDWTTYFVSGSNIPNTAKSVILETFAHCNSGNSNHPPCFGVRASSSAYVYTASFGNASGGGDNVCNGQQGVYPLYNHGGSPSFDYQLIQGFNIGLRVRVIGYYN